MAGPSVANELVGSAGTPLVLVDRPGWRVEYADQDTVRSGSLRFGGPVAAAGSPSSVELRWTDGGLASLMRERANSGPLQDHGLGDSVKRQKFAEPLAALSANVT